MNVASGGISQVEVETLRSNKLFFVKLIIFQYWYGRAEKLVLIAAEVTQEEFKTAFHNCQERGSIAIENTVKKMKVGMEIFYSSNPFFSNEFSIFLSAILIRKLRLFLKFLILMKFCSLSYHFCDAIFTRVHHYFFAGW